MKTSIESIMLHDTSSDSESEQEIIELTQQNLSRLILDLSIPTNTRIRYLDEFFKLYKDDSTFELLCTQEGMYMMSESSVIKSTLILICKNSNLSSMLKLKCANILVDYDNEYNALDIVCSDFDNIISSSCKVDAIVTLYKNECYRENAKKYFINFINDLTMDSEFRYKTILSIEKFILNQMIENMIENQDKNFFMIIYDKHKDIINNLFDKSFTFNVLYQKRKRLFRKILSNVSYSDIRYLYKTEINKPIFWDDLVYNLQFNFLINDNSVNYTILSGQYLLQFYCENNMNLSLTIQHIMLNIAEDATRDYNERADAADTILSYSNNTEILEQAQNIIIQLGITSQKDVTIFDNKQNVHTQEIEQSAIHILEFINNMTIKKQITFEDVLSEINKMLLTNKQETRVDNKLSNTTCKFCESYLINDKFCNSTCEMLLDKHEKIKVSLNRIKLDRCLYSKFSNTLENILLKVWNYISTSEFKDELKIRLLDELQDMSGTCSSGFLTRLVNVISGYEDNLNIKISWEQQIVANFVGRMNYQLKQLISNNNNSLFVDKIDEIILLWLNDLENEELLNSLKQQIDKDSKIDEKKQLVSLFLQNNKESKIQECFADFTNNIIEELSGNMSRYDLRQNYNLFFNVSCDKIRIELYEEFKQYITDVDFDLYFKKAIIAYEGTI